MRHQRELVHFFELPLVQKFCMAFVFGLFALLIYVIF